MYTIQNDKKVFIERHFSGVIGFLQEKLRSQSRSEVEFAKNFMSFLPCEKCEGKRLKKESLSVKINGLNIYEVSTFNIKQAFDFLIV